MHRNGRNSVEDGEAVARAPGSCRTAERDGPQGASSAFLLEMEKAGAHERQPRNMKKERGATPPMCYPKAAN